MKYHLYANDFLPCADECVSRTVWHAARRTGAGTFDYEHEVYGYDRAAVVAEAERGFVRTGFVGAGGGDRPDRTPYHKGG